MKESNVNTLTYYQPQTCTLKPQLKKKNLSDEFKEKEKLRDSKQSQKAQRFLQGLGSLTELVSGSKSYFVSLNWSYNTSLLSFYSRVVTLDKTFNIQLLTSNS